MGFHFFIQRQRESAMRARFGRSRVTRVVLLLLFACGAAYGTLLIGSTPTITAETDFGVAYRNSRGRYVCALATGRTGTTTRTATLTGYSSGPAIVIAANAATAPITIPSLVEGRALTIALNPASVPQREIRLAFHVESSMLIDTVRPWIDRSLLISNALFRAQRMGIFIAASTVDRFTLPVGAKLDCAFLDGLGEPTDGMMHVYVGPLTREMMMVGATCTGVRKILITASCQPDVLAHEVGHNLTLMHPTSPYPNGCIESNLMAPTAPARTDVTEGQTARAHTVTSSFIGSATAASTAADLVPVYESFWPATPVGL
jgi:hypothetical protein